MHYKREKVIKSSVKIRPSVKNTVKSKTIVKKDVKPVMTFVKKKRTSRVKITTPRSERISLGNTYNIIDKWAGSLSGHPAFIMGNGPSISSVELSLLNPYFTIGINRIFYIYDPTLLMWQDTQILMKERNNIEKQNAIKFCKDSVDHAHLFFNFCVLPGPFRIPLKPSELHGRGNTGALAVEFAVSLGCSSIVLLGMDCRYYNGKTDFYGKNKDHRPYTLKMCKNAMKWVKDYCPVPVYNCGDSDCWPKQSLQQVIDILKPEKFGREHFKSLLMR